MALEAQNNPFTSVLMVEAADPEALPDADPSAGSQRLAVGTDHLLYLVNSSGVKTQVGGASGAVATDAIWDAAGDLAVGSGANTAAKLVKGAAGANLSSYNGTLAWNGGTSFPASPATGDRYWRSDLGLEAYYNGTRWLTTQQYATDVPIQVALVPITANFAVYGPLANDVYDLWIETIYSPTQVGATNNGSNYWTIQFLRHASGTNIGSSFNTSADTAGVASAHTVTVNALSGTSDRLIEQRWTKTGSPGGAYNFGVVLTYRKVLT